MPCTEYSPAARAQLLAIARDALDHAVSTGAPLEVDTRGLPGWLTALRSCFVTLQRHGDLRGCTGSLEPSRPLATEVAAMTCQSALADPRFLPVRRHELETVLIELSVLSPLRPFPVRDEADLLEQLRPGHDGLVLQAGAYQATFLPKVWESLPTPRRFVGELKRKAGLPTDFWHEGVLLFRYHTETFSESAKAPA